MQDSINASNLLQNVDSLPSITALQNNTTITGGYVYITDVGFYYGDPTLTGLSATPDNNIIVDRKGIRWIFQPQLIISSNSNQPTFTDISVIDSINGYGQTTLNLLNVTGSSTNITNALQVGGQTTLNLLQANATDINGLLTASSIHNKGYAYINANATAATTTSTTSVIATGFGIVYTPVSTGNVLVKTIGMIANNTVGDGVNFEIGYGTGTALIAEGTTFNLTSITGMGITFTQEGLGDNYVPYNLEQVVTGLTVGTSYIFETGIEAITGGTVSNYLQFMSVLEI